MKSKALQFLVFLAITAAASAQTTSTEVLGNVKDGTGAVVAGAKVTLLRVETGERRVGTSTSTGDYSFPLIERGQYTVTVDAPGFKPEQKTGVGVAYQQKARVDFTLSVGGTSDSIEVTAQGVEMKTDDAVVGQVIDNQRVTELPINGRNIVTLAATVPGVGYGNRQGLQYNGESGGFVGGKVIAVTANGQRELNQQVTLDGVIATGSQVNVANLVPSVDAVQEIKVMTSSFSAEYGQNSGAIVQIAMKSGTNDVHGTLFEFLRNNAVVAKDYFLNFQLPPGAQQASKPILRRNQFGAFIGGPVILPKIYNGRNKTFWSFAYEGYRQTQETPAQAFWYPQVFRNGDFSALLTPPIQNGKPVRAPIIVFDPLTGTPFPNNVIPTNRINQPAQAFVNKYLPLPQTQPADILANNVQGLVPTVGVTDQFMWRIDHNFNENNRVFVRYLRDGQHLTSGNLNPNFPKNTFAWPTNVATEYLHIFNPRFLNEFRYGWNVVDDDVSNPRTGTNFDPTSLGLGTLQVVNTRKLTPAETGIPTVAFGPVTLGEQDNGAFDINRTHQITDNLTIIRGSHGFKMGAEWRHPELHVGASNNPRGLLTPGDNIGGYALAGFLLGDLLSTQTPEGLSFSAPRQNRYGAYVQDEWKAGAKLTINYGMRWDYFGVPTEPNGKWRTLSLKLLTQASDGRMLPTMVPAPGTPNYQFIQQENRYFMPRVGIAYRVAPKWVIRTGGGWFANGQQLDNFQILSRNPPQSGTFGYNAVFDPAQTIAYPYGGQTYNISTYKLRDGSPILTTANPFPGNGGLTGNAANVILMPFDNKQPTVVSWSFDVQRELPWQTVLMVAYVGNKSTHVETSIAGYNSPAPSTNTNIQGRRPYQAYVSQGQGNTPFTLGSIRYLDSNANADYNGLQVSIEKRFSAGLTFTGNYVYSKALGEGYERNGGNQIQDARNRNQERGRYPFDLTHTSSNSFVYQPPFLAHFKGWKRAVIGGWQTSGILTIHTGFPFTLNGGNLNTGGDITLPDRVANGSLGDKASRQQWYDPTAFRRTDCNIPNHPELCHYGNAGVYILNGPGEMNLDFSVMKDWRVPQTGERTKLQFRAEFFNGLNHPNFGNPSSNLSYASNDSVIPDGNTSSFRVGEIRSLNTPMRLIQFAMKLYF
ncbi:MAG: TonB-dependent receptor [Acidobacteriota bacterium]|nr:TonB-dependent receptor [Acidobacteriota bacterium]